MLEIEDICNEICDDLVIHRGGNKFCLLNCGLDAEIDGVIYHLTSEFTGRDSMGAVIDTIELERNNRQTA